MNMSEKNTDTVSIDRNIDINIKYLEECFKDCGDIIKRKFPVGENKELWLYVMYIDVMTDRTEIEKAIMTSLMIEIRKVLPEGFGGDAFNSLKNGGLTTADFKEVEVMETAVNEILSGNTLLLIDGCPKAFVVSTKGFPKRSVSEADTEVVVQGSKEAFTETFRVNTVLIRRRIRDTRLKVKQLSIGRRSKTDIALMYLEDVVRPEILRELEKRLAKIDIDAILDSGYIEQLIEDDWLSPFPQIQMTERPDKAASSILEGRVVVVVDNTPFVLMLPALFVSFYQSAEDYYQRWEIMSFLRVIRYIAGFISVVMPGLYIATAVYHPSMIPMELIFKMSEARKTVPIPAVLEILIMEIAFETLREAGIRLPAAVGSTLGIVGGIIIGQAAVEAGIVSPIVVIIISLTGICSFAIPNIALVAAYRLTKYMVLFFSAVLGLFGFWLAMLIILIHLVTLKSFGIPYLFPFTSVVTNEYNSLKDTIFRFPLFTMSKRPVFARPGQKVRMDVSKKSGKKVK